MSMFELRILPDEGESFDVTAGMRDIRMWEKTHKGRSMAMLRGADEGGAGVSATLMFEIAYSACRRQHLIPDGTTEDQFVEANEIDIETPDEKAARLRAEALTASIRNAGLESEVPQDDTPTR